MITSFGKTMCNISFRTRSTRKEFLYFLLMCLLMSSIFFSIIATFAIVILGLRIDLATGAMSIPYKMKTLGVLPFILMNLTICVYVIFAIWSFVAGSLLAIRRLHDLNCSGIGYWVWLASIVAFLVNTSGIFAGVLLYFIIGSVIALAISKSFQSDNKYGKVDLEELEYCIENQHG